MNLVDTAAERFLRIAALRWPEDLRDDQSREWAAELYAIRHDGEGRWRRAWTQLRFSLSLAASPPVEDPNRIPKGWREIMPQLGHTMRRALVLVAVGALCVVAQTLPRLAQDNLGGRVFAVLTAVAVAVVLCEAGRRLGRVMPLSLRDGRGLNATATAVLTVLCLGIVPVVVRGDVATRISLDWLTYVLWALAFAVLLALVFRLARSGRRTTAWLTGVLGGLALFEVLAVPMGIVYGYIGPISDTLHYEASTANLSQVDYSGTPMWFINGIDGWVTGRIYGDGPNPATFTTAVTSGLDGVVPVMLAATAFALGYLISSARHVTAPAVAAPVAAAATTSSARRYGGAAITVLGITTWAVVLGFMTPISGDFALGDLREYGYWGIVLAVVGLVWARSGRTGAVLSALGFGASVLVAGILIDRADVTGTGAFLLAAGLAGALAVAAWYLSAAMESRQPGTHGTRRTDIAIAILSGYSAAAALTSPTDPEGFGPTGSATLDAWLPVLATVAAVSFIGIAVAAAWTAREPRPSTVSAVLLLGPLVPLMAVLGWCTNHFGQVFWNVPPGVFLLVPVTVYLTAVIRWGRRERTLVDHLKWGGAVLVTAAGATVLFIPQAILGDEIGSALVELSAPGTSEDFAVPRMFGLLLAAASLAMLISSRTVREPRPKPVTATVDGPVTGEVAPA